MRDAARAAGTEGEVTLRVSISTEGRVERAEVLSAPSEALGAAAHDAMLTARFTPATRNGVAVATTIVYRYHFSLY